MRNWTKQAFQKHLQHRFSLRLHMCLILLATILSGVLFLKILLMLGVTDFRVRYPLSVLLSYLVFFACIRLWLLCISPNRSGKTNTIGGLDLPLPSDRSSGGGGIPSFRSGGGQFSGAGASGSFEGDNAAVAETSLLANAEPTPATSSSEGIGGAVGGVADALGDDNVIVAVIVLVVLVATVLGSTIYVLYDAPTILSEAAFQGFLAASLIRRTRAMSYQGWVGSVFRTTWKPFAVTVGVAFLSGVVLYSYFPEAVRLTDILWKR